MLGSLRKAPHIVSNLQRRVKFPEKFKGTIIEKWADYWKNLFLDYRQMLKDLRTDIQEEPTKALVWSAGLCAAHYLARNNPTEIEFKDSLKQISNEVALVSEDCLNPKSIDHLRFIQTCYNEHVIHYRSLGIISFMYTKEYNDSCDLYKAQCSYLKPSYITLPLNIVDIGFMGRWWNIYIKSSNYDVNA